MATQKIQPLQFEYCDLVMKGGITSGVVYPLAITELAERFFFKNIGGTSAGAIAAVISAAAEYGRRKGNQNAFAVVGSLPQQLSKEGFLLGLFRPSTSTRKVFRIFLDVLKFRSTPGRVLAAVWASFLGFWYWGLLGLAVGAIAPVIVYLLCHGPIATYVVLGLLWVFVFAAVFLILAVINFTFASICGNKFGLCSGLDSTGTQLLTSWLHTQVQLAAGRTPEDPPMTFGDLWDAPLFSGESLKTDRTINLQVVTSNLTQGRPFTIPFEARELYFDPSEFRELFPRIVVDWFVAHASQPQQPVQSSSGATLLHLPDAAEFPILVAARMSLSFPILLSAVPLYQVDFTLKRNAHPDPGEPLIAQKCWFSDGGICSNFPIQFFDSPLPRWPTFGIDLKAPHPEHSAEEEMVWLPTNPGSGIQVAWNRFDTGSSRQQVFGFVAAIINTMQNWRDNLQAVSSGYRDRIVHVSLRPDEGGLNLNMPPPLISTLSDRGRRAGVLLKTKFDLASHIFGRYRITMCGVQTYLKELRTAWTQPVIQQDDQARSFIEGTTPPPHYKPSPPLMPVLLAALKDLIELASKWNSGAGSGERFCREGAPKPEPVLRSQPKF